MDFEQLHKPIAKANFSERFQEAYSEIKLKAKTSCYKLFEANHKAKNESHMIRVLDTESQFVIANYDKAVTLFIQEIIYLCLRLGTPEAVIVENFEVEEKNIVFIMKSCSALQPNITLQPNISQLEKEIEVKEEKPHNLDVHKMLMDLVSDFDFIIHKMNIPNVSFEPSNFYHYKDANTFFLTNWSYSPPLNDQPLSQQLSASTINIYAAPEVINEDIQHKAEDLKPGATTIYALGLFALEMSGQPRDEWKDLPLVVGLRTYNSLLKCIIDNLDQADEVKEMVQIMLDKDPVSRFRIFEVVSELKKRKIDQPVKRKPQRCWGSRTDVIKYDDGDEKIIDIEAKSLPTSSSIEDDRLEESKNDEIQRSITRENSNTRSLVPLDMTPASMLYKIVWCTRGENVIRTQDLKTKTKSASFKGAQLNESSNSILITTINAGVSLIEQIPRSNQLISCNYNLKDCALEIIELGGPTPKVLGKFGPKKGNLNDISINKKSNLVALLSVAEKNPYHLLDMRTQKFTKAAPWLSDHRENLKNRINGIDIDPSGKKIAIIDGDGSCVVSEIFDDRLLFKIKMTSSHSNLPNPSRCRWNPLYPIIACYYKERMNLFDTEKQAFLLKDHLILDGLDGNLMTYFNWRWDGELLACSSQGKNAVIYDQRANSAVKKLKEHSAAINMVRWSPCGNLIATASKDQTVKVIDFHSDKTISVDKDEHGGEFINLFGKWLTFLCVCC